MSDFDFKKYLPVVVGVVVGIAIGYFGRAKFKPCDVCQTDGEKDIVISGLRADIATLNTTVSELKYGNDKKNKTQKGLIGGLGAAGGLLLIGGAFYAYKQFKG